MDKIDVKQADIELRKAILKSIVDAWDRPCTDGDMIDDRTNELDRIIARHRLATRTDATPVATDVAALVEAVKEARIELEAYEQERTGESYNNPKLNAALAPFTKGPDQ